MLIFLACCSLAGAAALLIQRLLSFASALQDDLDTHNLTVLEDPASIDPVTAPSIFSPATKALSIVVPAYNEQARLGVTLDEAISYLQRRRNRQGPHFTYEIIVVDDGSKDGTARVAYEYVGKHGFDTVRLLRVKKNRGKGHAVRQGMKMARGEFCLFMDADGATRFTDLEKLEIELAKCKVPASRGSLMDGPVGAALGSRAHLQKAAMSKRSPVRNFLMKVCFHFFTRV
ncbi:nucleotide-diphospho-sugar transferase [Dunaliella salina]|uniref:Nucleotide-diphospho-sugar transferase n=1 Tax=Dunaliella salina TaxID=3046 RepID=A0ABQ7GLX2_DUNSA|nr:nucleotide-diphospho-sugar transferase [Dunaliella salina]|eukprot:KAF5835610.1 nucleotide-diphospho-sugar transferase [Dunaliella salina]